MMNGRSTVRGEAMAAAPRVAGTCDTHMHVYGPADRFPCDRFEPDATYDDYSTLRRRLGIDRTVYVQASAYGRDHACLLDALARHGAAARAIAVVGTEAGMDDLALLDAAGVRGVRFFELTPGCLPISELEPITRHIAPLGWHALVQVPGDDLPDLETRLAALPCPYVIDHLGRIPPIGGVDHPAFRCLMRLLESGRCWVKVSAPYVASPDGGPAYPDFAARVATMVGARPDRLLWGSNWPHPGIGDAHKPDDAALMACIAGWCGDAAWPAVAAANAARLYGFADETA